MRSERGSITLFVLIAMIFFLAIAMSAYLSASSKLKGQNDEIEQIKAGYEQDLSKEGLAGLYDRLTEPKTLVSQIDASNYGDFIDYGINIDNSDSGHINGWKIFYANDKGTYIIAADYVHTSKLASAVTASGNTMKTTGSYMLSWNTPSYKTFLESTKKLFMYNSIASTSNNNVMACSDLINTNYWTNFVADGATYAIGTPTLELFRASWNDKTYPESEGTHTKLQLTDSNNGYYVALNNTDGITASETSARTLSDAGYGDELYFPRQTAEWNGASGYWLASPSASSTDILYIASWNGDISSVSSYDKEVRAIRPVVFLPNTIKATYNDNLEIWEIERE